MPQQADTVPIDRYIVDTLMRDLVGHDRQPSAYLVYVFLWHETHGQKKPTTQLALIDIAEGVGLSKRGVQDALGHLGRRKLIAVERESITAVPVYTVRRPWRR
jgi:DNA-binding GntR family transcriptional regulator